MTTVDVAPLLVTSGSVSAVTGRCLCGSAMWMVSVDDLDLNPLQSQHENVSVQ